MILVIGGAYQGKTTYAKRIADPCVIIVDGAVCTERELLSAGVVLNLHMYVKEVLDHGEDIQYLADKLIKENPGVIIVCNELGCGLVPMDARDRRWREETGRICGRLADASEEVYRVFAGLPQKLK